MEFIGAFTAMAIVLQIAVIGLAVLLYPVFWIWMLVDAVLRADHEYPGGGANDKIVWVLLIALFQIVSVIYFFAVFRAVKRGTRPSPPAAASPTGTHEVALPQTG